jgi:serine protease Do
MRGKAGWGVALACVAWSAAARGREAEPEKFWREAKSPRRSHPSQLARAAARALPAVVAITTHTSAQSSQDSAGLGAGFIVTPDGYILTSEHVVEGATDVRVQLWNAGEPSEEVPARVVGVDKATDTALLKVDVRRRLPSLRLASAADVQLADWVVVIGNPFGLSQSVTVGVVSYQGRTDINPTGAPGYLDDLQTDAPINPGSSGGPILDLAGDVVAIANAVNVSGQGIGFGIPIDIAKAVLPQLKASGSVRRGWLGGSVEDLTPELTEVFHARPPGVLV